MNKIAPEEVRDIRGHLVNWPVIIFFVIFHTLAIVALFTFSWSALIVAIALYWVGGSLGIGMGYHRLLTHRGYKVPTWVEYFLSICGALALEGGPIAWVATHRIHHARSDKEGDPHSPRDGAWWSHMGWIYSGKSLEKNSDALKRYAPDLTKSAFHRWLTTYYYVPVLILAVGLFAMGGVSFVLWGIFLRITFAWHTTWLVNSATHMWGSRRFESRDDSRNNWWVALLSFGEGWHNNHHAHPASARHGLAWYEIDLNWYGIRVLQMLGLAKKVRVVTLEEPVEVEAPLAMLQPNET